MDITTENLFEYYSDILENSIYYISKPDKNNLISFVEGYSKGCKNKELINYLRLYLLQNYQINAEYNNWVQQVDHYSFLKNMEWFEGFDHLLSEVLKKHKPVRQIEASNDSFLIEIPRGEIKESIKLNNGEIISSGDLLKLGDKIGQDYKQTRFYDASLRNPSWDLFYPSDKDFKYVEFYYQGKRYFEENTDDFVTTFGNVRRILSNSIIKIASLAIQDDEVIAYTKLFRIRIEKAINAQEVKIINQQDESFNLSDLSSLEEKVEQYRIGLFPSLSEEVSKWSFYNLRQLNKSWYNYRFSMGMQWDKINNTSN